MDFRYLNGSGINHSWFSQRYSLKMSVEEDPNKPLII